MSDTRTETVPLVDGTALRLTVAEPVGPARGGIVVLHEARGMTDAVRGMVTGLAAEGWLTVAPHLYHRDDADELGEDDGERVDAQVGRLESGAVMADTDTAFGWLADHEITADRMGVLGFDVGAVVALLVATERTLGAAVSVADEAGMVVGPRAPPVAVRRRRRPDLPVAGPLRQRRRRRRGRREAARGRRRRRDGDERGRLPAQRPPLRRRPRGRRRRLEPHPQLVRRPPAVTRRGSCESQPGGCGPLTPRVGAGPRRATCIVVIAGGRQAPGGFA